MASSTIDTLSSDRVELRDGDIDRELVSESIRLREGRLLVSGKSADGAQIPHKLIEGLQYLPTGSLGILSGSPSPRQPASTMQRRFLILNFLS